MKINREPCFIEPSIWRKLRPPIGPGVILFPDMRLMEKYAEKAGLNREKSIRINQHNYLPPIQENGFGAAGPALGAPMAAALSEVLIALGSKAVILMGYCGAIGKGIFIGDWVIPTWAYSEEGTSSHYLPGKIFSSDPMLTASLHRRLLETGRKLHVGPTWTTDAFYRETKSKVAFHRESGRLAVEMELSAVFSVASYRGIKAGALLIVSDMLTKYMWVPGFKTPPLQASVDQAITELAQLKCHIL